MAATLLSDTVWEGLSVEMTDDLPSLRDGHFYKQADTGESYFRRGDTWEYVNLGLAFIKATKSGRVVTDANGDAQIIFNTPFIDDQYSIALGCADSGGPPNSAALAFKWDRLATGFRIKTRGTNSQPKAGVEVSWLCTRDYNP